MTNKNIIKNPTGCAQLIPSVKHFNRNIILPQNYDKNYLFGDFSQVCHLSNHRNFDQLYLFWPESQNLELLNGFSSLFYYLSLEITFRRGKTSLG